MAALVMFRGDSFPYEFQIKRNEVPVDLTGFTLWWTAKRYVSDPDQQAVSRLDNGLLGGVTIVDALQGKVRAVMPASATLLFPDTASNLFYDLQMKDLSGVVTTVDSGTIAVSADVTRTIA